MTKKGARMGQLTVAKMGANLGYQRVVTKALKLVAKKAGPMDGTKDN